MGRDQMRKIGNDKLYVDCSRGLLILSEYGGPEKDHYELYRHEECQLQGAWLDGSHHLQSVWAKSYICVFKKHSS